jgi:AhpD family alkylhydroperoxidase
MHPRIDNPALTVPGASQAMQGIANAAKQADIPETTLYLVELRASQINGCGVCVDIHTHELKHAATGLASGSPRPGARERQPERRRSTAPAVMCSERPHTRRSRARNEPSRIRRSLPSVSALTASKHPRLVLGV